MSYAIDAVIEYHEAPSGIVNPVATLWDAHARTNDNLKIWNRVCAEVDPHPKGELRAVIVPPKRGDPRDPFTGGRSARFSAAIEYRERTGWQPNPEHPASKWAT